MPTTYKKATDHVEWRTAIKDELSALELNRTWDIIDLPRGNKLIGFK